jgi:hypothetical protein
VTPTLCIPADQSGTEASNAFLDAKGLAITTARPPASLSRGSRRQGKTTRATFQQGVERMSTKPSIDAELASIERRTTVQTMLMGQPEQGGVGQIHWQIEGVLFF